MILAAAALAIAAIRCSSDADPVYACRNALPGVSGSAHTDFSPDAPPPHWIELDLVEPQVILAVEVDRRGDGGVNGHLVDYAVDVDSVPAASGRCSDGPTCRIVLPGLAGTRVRVRWVSSFARGAVSTPAVLASAEEVRIEGRCDPATNVELGGTCDGVPRLAGPFRGGVTPTVAWCYHAAMFTPLVLAQLEAGKLTEFRLYFEAPGVNDFVTVPCRMETYTDEDGATWRSPYCPLGLRNLDGLPLAVQRLFDVSAGQRVALRVAARGPDGEAAKTAPLSVCIPDHWRTR